MFVSMCEYNKEYAGVRRFKWDVTKSHVIWLYCWGRNWNKHEGVFPWYLCKVLGLRMTCCLEGGHEVQSWSTVLSWVNTPGLHMFLGKKKKILVQLLRLEVSEGSPKRHGTKMATFELTQRWPVYTHPGVERACNTCRSPGLITTCWPVLQCLTLSGVRSQRKQTNLFCMYIK